MCEGLISIHLVIKLLTDKCLLEDVGDFTQRFEVTDGLAYFVENDSILPLRGKFARDGGDNVSMAVGRGFHEESRGID
jgi:hypothetical protein